MSLRTGWEILVWDVTFYKCDGDYNPLKNKNGDIQLFTAPGLETYRTISDLVDDDLEEID